VPSQGQLGDVGVDFMDMTNDRHVWVRSADARPGVEIALGRYVVVGDEDADPKVARIVAVDADGNVELEILRGERRVPRRLARACLVAPRSSTGSSTGSAGMGRCAEVRFGTPEMRKPSSQVLNGTGRDGLDR
jgi:hypothetical protein